MLFISGGILSTNVTAIGCVIKSKIKISKRTLSFSEKDKNSEEIYMLIFRKPESIYRVIVVYILMLDLTM